VEQVWLSIVVIKYLPAVNDRVNSASACFPLEKTPVAPFSMYFSAWRIRFSSGASARALIASIGSRSPGKIASILPQ
jgi:hypothetical protein